MVKDKLHSFIDIEDHEMNKAFLNVLRDKQISSPSTLSEITGIDKATISRQINNKQALSLEHINIYSEKLNVPKIRLIDEYVPTYWIVGYYDQLGIVTARHEEDGRKAVFKNSIQKIEGEKVLYNETTNHLLRYNVNFSNCSHDLDLFLDKFCFIRETDKYLSGYIAFVTKISKTSITLRLLNGEVFSKSYYKVYGITETTNLNFSIDTTIVDL